MSTTSSLVETAAEFLGVAKAKTRKSVIYEGSKKPLTVPDIEERWFKLTQHLETRKIPTSKLTPKALYSYIENHLLKAGPTTFRRYEDVTDFVTSNLETVGIVIDQMGRVDIEKSENPIDALYTLAENYNREAKTEGWPLVASHLIERVFSIIRFKRPKEAVQQIIEKVSYDPEANGEGFLVLAKLLRPEDSDEQLAIHADALRHYIWQIKRKLNGDYVLDPLMIYISGNQGVGKSSILRHLNQAILGEFYLEQDVGDALDARSTESRQYYSILADEINYCNDETVSKIKKLLTSTVESSRVLGTNSVMKVRNNTTWAATSNHSLMTTIYDETGLRRFWELAATIPEGGVIDWKVLNSLDIETLWRSVDETSSKGYYNRALPTWDRMRAHQNESVAKSHAHAFLYTAGFLQDTDENYCWCSGKDLFKQYTEWAEENSIKSKSQSRIWFNRKMQQMGVESIEFDREKYFWLQGSSSGVHVQEGDRPNTPGVTVASTNDKELAELISPGFSKSSDVRVLEEKK